jgi:hypothetical protein
LIALRGADDYPDCSSNYVVGLDVSFFFPDSLLFIVILFSMPCLRLYNVYLQEGFPERLVHKMPINLSSVVLQQLLFSRSAAPGRCTSIGIQSPPWQVVVLSWTDRFLHTGLY